MTIRIVGAGMAGLAAAVESAELGAVVELSDAAVQAGGRCRSYRDPKLGRTIDNGNHLVLSGNEAVMRYLKKTGGSSHLSGPDQAEFRFVDLRTGERWCFHPNDGRLPWWMLVPRRRLPATHFADYVPLIRLMGASADQRVADLITTTGPLWERLLEPVLLAALNTSPADASAKLAGAVLRESILRGGRAVRPRIAEPTLAATFIDPALRHLERNGVSLALGRRLRRLHLSNTHVTGLEFSDAIVSVGPGEAVILALPATVAAELVPDLAPPDEFRAIVNAHFAVTNASSTSAMIGVIGGTAEWIFVFPDRISVTVSAADHLLAVDRAELAARFWKDIEAVLQLPPALPPWQIVKEKRATFAATPAQDARRPGAVTRWHNLFLAGDWTATGLPSTIEGAIRSGERAARLAHDRLGA